MTTIARFPSSEDAHLFRSFLESRGVEGFLYDENITQLFWNYTNAVGGIRLAVNDDDADDARTVYNEYMTALRNGPYPVAPVRAWPVVALLTLIFGIPFLIFGRHPARDEGSSVDPD